MTSPFFFRVWPYVALAILTAGFVVRYTSLLLRRRGARSPSLYPTRGTSSRFEVWAWALLFLLHAAAIVAPSAIIGWNASPVRLYALEGASFLVGLAVLVSTVFASWRHFLRRTSLSNDVFDSAFLGLALTGIVSGLALAVFHRWASTWGAAILTPYLVSLAHGVSRGDYVEQMPFLVQLHVFAAFAAIAVAPFTSFSLLAIDRIERATARPLGFLVRPAAGARPLSESTASLEDLAAAEGEGPMEQG